jgi:hypothetical protein
MKKQLTLAAIASFFCAICLAAPGENKIAAKTLATKSIVARALTGDSFLIEKWMQPLEELEAEMAYRKMMTSLFTSLGIKEKAEKNAEAEALQQYETMMRQMFLRIQAARGQ